MVPLMLLACVTFAVTEPAPTDEASLLYRLAAGVGGSYASNVYFNASELADLAAVAGVTVDVDWLAADELIIKGRYEGELRLYNDISTERHYIHEATATLGLRPIDAAYTWIDAGGKQLYYPDRPELCVAGGLGRLGGRWEVGDSSTVEMSYRFGIDSFPDYDLDNIAHQGQVQIETGIGDHMEIRLPLSYEALMYRERFVLDSAGQPTAKRPLGQRFRLQPGLSLLPSFAWRIDLSLDVEYNRSNASYYYVGPFGVEDSTVDPELISQFDTYLQSGGLARARWDIGRGLSATVMVEAGMRRFVDRPAYDAMGLPLGEHEVDIWLAPKLAADWQFLSMARIRGEYAYLRQWSNDALWDFDRHAVRVVIETWIEN
jgi:hypothetical protein